MGRTRTIRKKRTYSLVRHKPGEMNATELRYFNDYLKPKLLSGFYLKSRFEPLTLILVHPDKQTGRRSSTYTPDFYLIRSDGITEVHEVKGYCDEADKLKLKLAAELFPEWMWFMAYSTKKSFNIKEY